MKKLAVFVLAAVLCLSIAAVCFADEIVIGGINDLTGNRSVTGNAINNGAILAFEEINAAGGINGDMIKFVSYDNKNDTQETINAYTRLVDVDNAAAVLSTDASSIFMALIEISTDTASVSRSDGVKMTERERRELIQQLEIKMRKAAQMLEYEIAAQLRDEIIRLRGVK